MRSYDAHSSPHQKKHQRFQKFLYIYNIKWHLYAYYFPSVFSAVVSLVLSSNCNCMSLSTFHLHSIIIFHPLFLFRFCWSILIHDQIIFFSTSNLMVVFVPFSLLVDFQMKIISFFFGFLENWAIAIFTVAIINIFYSIQMKLPFHRLCYLCV